MAILIGLIIGSVLGLTGAGGSIFAVPLLILLLGLPASDAMAIALGAVAASAALGTLKQYKTVLWVPAGLLASGGMLAAPLGKWVAMSISESLLVTGFAAIAIWIAIRMLKQAMHEPLSSNHVRASAAEADDMGAMACKISPTGQFQLKPRCISGLVIGGLGIGFASGLFGVGGGFLIVPLLLALSSLSMPRAIATSLATITLISSVGFASHYALAPQGANAINLTLMTQVIGASAIGMLISQQLSQFIAGSKLQITFSILLIAVSLILLTKHFL